MREGCKMFEFEGKIINNESIEALEFYKLAAFELLGLRDDKKSRNFLIDVFAVLDAKSRERFSDLPSVFQPL